MAIIVNLDVMMAKRKMSLSELSEKVDITLANLSILKNNKAKAVRFSTLETICAALVGCRYERAAVLEALQSHGIDGAVYRISAEDMAGLLAD